MTIRWATRRRNFAGAGFGSVATRRGPDECDGCWMSSASDRRMIPLFCDRLIADPAVLPPAALAALSPDLASCSNLCGGEECSADQGLKVRLDLSAGSSTTTSRSFVRDLFYVNYVMLGDLFGLLQRHTQVERSWMGLALDAGASTKSRSARHQPARWNFLPLPSQLLRGIAGAASQ